MVKYVTSFKEVGLESCRNSLKGEKKRELKRNEIQFVLKKLPLACFILLAKLQIHTILSQK